MKLHRNHIILLILLITLALIFLIVNYHKDRFFTNQPITFGVSYSPSYAKELGLDPKLTYLDMLQNLKVKNIRLSAYWDEIEPIENQFIFSDLDWYVNQAEKQNTNIILAIGYKLPRWPECREPDWNKNQELNVKKQNRLKMLTKVIEHYDKNPAISAWQLENEPLLEFGICPKIDREFLKEEITFVKTKTTKPIVLTDSGELRPWITPMGLSDIFGTTLYRVVESPFLGQIGYPLRPYFYRIKSDLVRAIFAPNSQKTIISELQAEGWGGRDETITFPLSQFMENVSFARKTGFSEAYLWGVEWWYYISTKGHPEYLKYAKTLF